MTKKTRRTWFDIKLLIGRKKALIQMLKDDPLEPECKDAITKLLTETNERLSELEQEYPEQFL